MSTEKIRYFLANAIAYDLILGDMQVVQKLEIIGKKYFLHKKSHHVYKAHGVILAHPASPIRNYMIKGVVGSNTLDALANRKPYCYAGTEYKVKPLKKLLWDKIPPDELRAMNKLMWVFSEMLPNILKIYEEVDDLTRKYDSLEVVQILKTPQIWPTKPYLGMLEDAIIVEESKPALQRIECLKEKVLLTYNTNETLGTLR